MAVQLKSEAVLGHVAAVRGAAERARATEVVGDPIGGVGAGGSGRRVDGEVLGVGTGSRELGGLGHVRSGCFVHFCGPGPVPPFTQSEPEPWKASTNGLAGTTSP